jgi:hypothetical protein
MRAKAFFYVCSWVFLLALAAARAGASQAVTLRLRPEVTTVRQGDSLRFDLTLTNTGAAPVRVWVPVMWGTGREPLFLKIRAANGVERVRRPASCLAGFHDGPQNFVVLATGDSVSVRLGIGDTFSTASFDRRVLWWSRMGTRPQGPLPMQQVRLYSNDGWDGFAGAGEYRVSVSYDLRHTEEPLFLLASKPDSSANVPLLRALLRAPAVRVVVTPR